MKAAIKLPCTYLWKDFLSPIDKNTLKTWKTFENAHNISLISCIGRKLGWLHHLSDNRYKISISRVMITLKARENRGLCSLWK
jgi:hypothetical protein